MLDYGYRSMCCKAPIRLGRQKKNHIIKTVWVCTKCRKSNVNIVSSDDLNFQEKSSDDFSDTD